MTINLQNINNLNEIAEIALEQQKPFLKLKFYGYKTCIIKDTIDNLNNLHELLLKAELLQEDIEENIFSEDFSSLDDDLNTFIQQHKFLSCIDFRTLHHIMFIK